MAFGRKSEAGYTWSQCDPTKMGELVRICTGEGTSAIFGSTRDRSAATFTVIRSDGAKESFFIKSDDEFSELLSDIASAEFVAWCKTHG